MAIVLSRLHGLLNSSDVDSVNPAMIKLMVEEDSSLILEYNTLRALLERTLFARDHKKAIELVNEALDLAQRLDKQYDKYINASPALQKSVLQSHIAAYSRWLGRQPVDNAELSCCVIQDIPYAPSVRRFTETLNPYRLSVLRVRRLLLVLVPVINNLEHYGSWILWADKIVGPYLTYFSMVFFIPRLLSNLMLLLTHVIEHDGMSDEEIALGWYLRFCVQWSRLWPQLLNDVGWITNGVLMSFVFIDLLQPLSIYLTFIMQAYDLVTAIVRAYYELDRLHGLEIHYQSQTGELVSEYLGQLNQRIAYERNMLYLNLANFIVLFIGVCLSLPMLAIFNPLLAVVGATMAVMMTGIAVGGRYYLNQQIGGNDYVDPRLPLRLDALLENPEYAMPESLIHEESPVVQDEEPVHEVATSAVLSPSRNRSRSNESIFVTYSMFTRAASIKKIICESPTSIIHSNSKDDFFVDYRMRNQSIDSDTLSL